MRRREVPYVPADRGLGTESLLCSEEKCCDGFDAVIARRRPVERVGLHHGVCSKQLQQLLEPTRVAEGVVAGNEVADGISRDGCK